MPIDPRSLPASRRDPSFVAPSMTLGDAAAMRHASTGGTMAAHLGLGVPKRMNQTPAITKKPGSAYWPKKPLSVRVIDGATLVFSGKKYPAGSVLPISLWGAYPAQVPSTTALWTANSKAAAVLLWNGKSVSLPVGSELTSFLVPSYTSGQLGAAPPERCAYRTNAGDTLLSIATKLGTTVAELQSMNPGVAIGPNVPMSGAFRLMTPCR